VRAEPGGLGRLPGFIPLPPPRGIGFDVSGIVDAVGEGVADLMVGDRVFVVPDYIGYRPPERPTTRS
jgi:NADPH:quinone reductase-like Zn-dependent oxidoreductase